MPNLTRSTISKQAFESNPSALNEYAEKLLQRSEQKAKARKAAVSTASESKSAAEPSVSVEIEILIKIEERTELKWGLGAALPTEGRTSARAILLALNRTHNPLLRRALLESDHDAVRHFAAWLLAALIVFHRKIGGVSALEKKIKADAGVSDISGWQPSHLALGDMAAASDIFERIGGLPIFGPAATLGQSHPLGSFTVNVSEADAKESWDMKGWFQKRRKEGRLS